MLAGSPEKIVFGRRAGAAERLAAVTGMDCLSKFDITSLPRQELCQTASGSACPWRFDDATRRARLKASSTIKDPRCERAKSSNWRSKKGGTDWKSASRIMPKTSLGHWCSGHPNECKKRLHAAHSKLARSNLHNTFIKSGKVSGLGEGLKKANLRKKAMQPKGDHT